ncbi:metal dependent phosphohydrolase [Magnetococcus marinus MC-1]|uniref:Metal dependent phosphohydrolase n=1 Tax=Magnetococcus marinus (strain ATCC BAA-1437 / JCM 17883 / MC-1) TaxID=156889 RepID=A0LDH1_MAGMM|nr:HD-GYP domain-containing protein [Magnetococcus marinus]ABK46014.1 metal dependent phosphohydrolase [Magnetococcus marinus MC-1]
MSDPHTPHRTYQSISGDVEKQLLDQLAELSEGSRLTPISEQSEEAWCNETVQAFELMAATEREMALLLADVQAGEPVSTEPLDLSIAKLNVSLATDPEALLSLSLLRTFDGEGFDHTINVSVYMMALGRGLELPDQQVILLGKGGLLHDVGKVRLPQSLINKTTPLDLNDLRFIKDHVRLTLDSLSRMEALPPEIMRLVAEHHERLDGSGYPSGLKGDQISPYGRIAAICDCFDAMTSKRSYRRAKTGKQVLRELVQEGRERGTLDVKMVELFIRVVGIYPVGSLVRLADGHLGVVMRNNPRDLLHPTIKLVAKGENNLIMTPQRLDLARHRDDEKLRIVGTESPAATRIDPLAFLPAAHLFVPNKTGYGLA